MWPFKSKTQKKKKMAIQHLKDLIDYREGVLDAANYFSKDADAALVKEIAQEWFFLLKALKIVKGREE